MNGQPSSFECSICSVLNIQICREMRKGLSYIGSSSFSKISSVEQNAHFAESGTLEVAVE